MIYSQFEACEMSLADVEAIDFYLARQLAGEYGQEQNELLFHLLLALHFSIRQGHSCLPVESVANKTLFAESSGEPDRDDALHVANLKAGFTFPDTDTLIKSLAFLWEKQMGEGLLVFEREALYLRRYWHFECEVAHALKSRRLFTPLPESQLLRAQNIVTKIFRNSPDQQLVTPSSEHGIGIPDWPKIAVANALGRKFSVITGGPGTGKTFAATRLLIAMQATFGDEAPQRIIMAAPTGKAAQRLNESVLKEKPRLRLKGIESALIDSIPENAMTLHRLLGIGPRRVQPKYGEEKRIDCDILLLDEVSMIDLPMLARLLRALPDHATLIMLGDAEQLPSVEVGSILAELVGPETICYQHRVAEQIVKIAGHQNIEQSKQGGNDFVTRLMVSQRFGGAIKTLADQVISGQAEGSWNFLLKEQNEPGQPLPENNNQQQTARQLHLVDDHSGDFHLWLKAICRQYFYAVFQSNSKQEAFAALKKFRILTPTRIGERGVIRLNQLIESILAKAFSGVKVNGHYKGQPLMVTDNNYSYRLFNGDIGLIWPEERSGKLMAWFEQEGALMPAGTDLSAGSELYRAVSLARLPASETVYAMTIHKTQGSEFDHVAIVLPSQVSGVLSRQLLYTGITRAKSQLCVVGNKDVWLTAVGKRAERFSKLGERLSE